MKTETVAYTLETIKNITAAYWPSGSSYDVVGMFEYDLSAGKATHQEKLRLQDS